MDWQRIIVGDAFKLKKHPRFYVDLALFFPLPIAAIMVFASVSAWPPSAWDGRELRIGICALVVCLLLCKERLLMIAVLFGYVAYASGWRAMFVSGKAQSELGAIAAVSGALCGLVIVLGGRRDVRPYESPPTRSDWFITLTGAAFVAACLAVILLNTVRWWAAR